MMTHDDIRREVCLAVTGLSPVERAALGVAIIQSIRQTGDFSLVNRAGRIVAEHGQMLCQANMVGLTYLPEYEYPTEAITHENIESRERVRPRRSRAWTVPAWLRRSRLWAVLTYIEDSVIGDVIGALALFVILFGGLFWGGAAMSKDAPLFRVREIGKQFAVVNAANERVSPFFRRREAADEVCKSRLSRAESNLKKCLCCGGKFLSEGPHNRLCNLCRSRDAASVEALRIALPGGVF